MDDLNSVVITRRRFLQGAASLGAAIGLSDSIGASAIDEKPIDCLVLGAGMAGISAASHLRLSAKNLSVVVLEGADRIGGRIHTVRDVFDGPIEAGAEYIHR